MKIDLCEIFGVNPDQMFYISENRCSAYPYRVHDNILQYIVSKNTSKWDVSLLEVNELLELKIALYLATEVEKTLLENLPDQLKNGWIIRDTHNDLFVCTSEPQHVEDRGFYTREGKICRFPFNNLFEFVKPNLEAIKISDIL